MKRIFLISLSIVSSLLAGCNDGDGNLIEDGDKGWEFNASSLTVTPETLTLPIGLTESLTATAHIEGESSVNVTTNPALTWKSSDEESVSVDEQGRIMALKASDDEVTITATGINADGSEVKGSSIVTVSTAVVNDIQVTPNNGYNTLVVGVPVGYTATGNLSDGTTRDLTVDPALAWSSSNDDVVTVTTGVGEDSGIVTGQVTGQAEVIASLTANGVEPKGSAMVTILDASSVEKFEVLPVESDATPEVIVNNTIEFVANLTVEGRVLNVTDSAAVEWFSSDESAATVDAGVTTQRATVTGLAEGSTEISATATVNNNSYPSNSVSLDVIAPLVEELTISAEHDSIPALLPQQMTATAILSNDGSDQDVTNNVTWSIDSESTEGVATLEGNILTGHKEGTVVVKAEGITPDEMSMSATKEVVITSDVISSIDVNPGSYAIPSLVEKAFTATAIVDGSQTYDVTDNPAINWVSDHPSIATVSDSGVATAQSLSEGSATTTITATLLLSEANAPKDSATLVVTSTPVDVLEVSSENDTVAIGLVEAMTANVRLQGDSTPLNVTESVSWSSDNANVTVTSGLESGNGQVTVAKDAVSGDVAMITATLSNEDGSQELVDSKLLTVSGAVGDSITIAAKSGESTGDLPLGLTRAYEATLTLTDDSDVTRNENPDLTWSVVAGGEFISVDSKTGVVTAIGVGAGQIQATYSGPTLSGNPLTSNVLDVTTSNAVMVDGSLIIVARGKQVEAEEVNLPEGVSSEYAALAAFTDNPDSLVDVTSETDWVLGPDGQSNASLDTSTIADDYVTVTADAVSTSPLLLTATSQTYANIQDTLSINVVEAELVSIKVEPDPISIAPEGNVQLTVTGTYTNAEEHPITEGVLWGVEDENVAVVDEVNYVITAVGEPEETTTLTASIEQNNQTIDASPVSVEILFVPAICGDTVNDTSLTNAVGECLKVTSAGDISNNWFAAAPSEAVMNAMGYTQDSSDENSGDTYALISSSTALFTQTGADVVLPGEGNDAKAGVNGQFDRWCQKLGALNFAGRSDWRRPELDEVTELYNSVEAPFSDEFGWLIDGAHSTTEVNGTYYKARSLSGPTISNLIDPDDPMPGACVSDSSMF